MVKILNRVGMLISTTGTGTVTADTLISNRFNTPAEAGAVNGESYYWLLEQGNDYEIFEGAWTLSGTLVSRDTVIESKISGVHGTTKLTLDGSAMLRSISPAEAFLSGWTQIGSTVTVSSPVANVTFTSIPQTFSELYLLMEGVSHNSGSAQGVSFKTSVDGSTFSSNSLATINTALAANPVDLVLLVTGYSLDESILTLHEPGTVSANNLDVISTSTLASAKHSAGMEGLRATPSGGSFDAGTFKLFGR